MRKVCSEYKGTKTKRPIEKILFRVEDDTVPNSTDGGKWIDILHLSQMTKQTHKSFESSKKTKAAPDEKRVGIISTARMNIELRHAEA